MRSHANLRQLILHTLVAVFVTSLTLFLGGAFFRMIRMTQGSVRYWSAGAVVTLVLILLRLEVLGVGIGSIWMTLGLYSELELRGRGWKISGFFSLTSGFLVGLVGFGGLLWKNEITTWERFVGLFKEWSDLLTQMGLTMKMNPDLLAQGLPSMWIAIVITNLGMALIFERPLFAWYGFPRERVASHLKLLEFRLPDFCIWFALTGLLLSLVDLNSKALSLSGDILVSTFGVLYFFQGIAILEVLLNLLKASGFWRTVVYLVVVGQVLPLVSLVGLIDFWVDFRARMAKAKPDSPANHSGDGGSL